MNSSQLEDLLDWVRPIQQALRIESEKGFTNIVGRGERFHEFVSRKFSTFPLENLPTSSHEKIKKFGDEFSSYPTWTESRRRRIVIDSRQFLYGLIKQTKVDEAISIPRLKLAQDQDSSARSSKIDRHLNLDSPLVEVRGVGPKIAGKLASLGLLLVKDLLNYYPRDYVDYSSLRRISTLEVGKTATLVATVRRCNGFPSPKNPNLSILELHLQDLTGRIKVTRFFAGKRFSSFSFIKSQTRLYPQGATVAVSGLVKEGTFGLTFNDPLIEVMENTSSTIRSTSIGRLIPVYPLTDGLTAEKFRDLVGSVLPMAQRLPDHLSIQTLKAQGMPSLSEAIVGIHSPKDQQSLNLARRRLVFDEFFLLQIGLLKRRAEFRRRPSALFERVSRREGLVGRFLDGLPFVLTTAQQNVLDEIEGDLSQKEPMARLVQGDVGCGKTVVAIATLLNAVEEGWQVAFMAPTEVLAEQHHRTLGKWLPQLHVTSDLLTGSTRRTYRRKILDDVGNGSLKVLIGTHALLEDPVSFSRLGLVIVDEQHRFGVHQRNKLLSKGLQPHLLTMTATPIPRTLALSIHGDLDISQINELPPGRKVVQTRIITSAKRDEAYQLIRDEVNCGQRAYVVLPLVDESEKLDLRSAVMVYKQLSEEIFPEFRVGLLHGKMSGSDKQTVIRNFALGNYQVLVSTTVVEVGVDVPEASVMMIDHAERFGLAQLHQLRGRVGRGAAVSHCLLVNGSSNSHGRERLDVMVRSNDGFEISEIDLRLRGPGQILGTKQSGLPDFALASLSDDGDILQEARKEAQLVLESDPELLKNNCLRKLLESHWDRLISNANLN